MRAVEGMCIRVMKENQWNEGFESIGLDVVEMVSVMCLVGIKAAHGYYLEYINHTTPLDGLS